MSMATKVGCGCEKPRQATCGICGRSWCDRCDGGRPSWGCHYCHGRGYSTAPIDDPEAQDRALHDAAIVDAEERLQDMAPDLLTALERIASIVVAATDGTPDRPLAEMRDVYALQRIAREAIDKAEGGTE